MKKILMLLTVVVITVSQLIAQKPSFEKGDKVIDLSIGLPYLYGYHMVFPPVTAAFELGIVDGILEKAAVGVGGYAGFSSYKWGDYNFSNFSVGVRGAFHYPFVDKLDTYAGILTGYSFGISASSGADWPHNPSNFDYGMFVGLRYYFTNTFAVMAEAGYGITFIQAGVSFKF